MKCFALATLAALLFSAAIVPDDTSAGLLDKTAGPHDEFAGPQDKSASADEIQIKQLERAWNQAEAKQEVKQVSSLMADTLTYTDYDGSFMNKVEYMKWVVAPEQKADHLYEESLNVQVYGNAAVATGIYRESGTNKGKHYVIRSRFTDTWIRHGGIWQCVASHSTLIPGK